MIIRRQTRPGYSLIEMLTVISALLLVLTLSALLIHQSLRLDRGERARSNVGANLERLAREFRADLHDVAGPIDRQDAKLTIPQGNGRSVEYLARPGDVLRTLSVDGKPKAHDIFPRPKATSLRFVSQTEGGNARLAIVLQGLAGQPFDPIYRDYAIEAEVGRHVRMTGEGAKR